MSVGQVSSLWGAIKKTSFASSWHFISTHGVAKFIQFSLLGWCIQFDSLFEVLNILKYEGWNFNSGNYLFTTDTNRCMF